MTATLNEKGTITAARIHSFGGPDAVCVEDIDRPEPGPDEVLVQVHAAGVNPLDWKEREGQIESLPMPRTLGTDFSGVVEALGPGVTDFCVGQPVFGHSAHGGAFAEFVVAPVSSIAPKPPTVDDIEAAATPLSAMTAWQALFEAANLQSNQRVLILGGSGGVGMFAVQLALRRGAWVIATASSRNLPFLRRLGAHEAIDHAVSNLEQAVKRVDVVLDLVGREAQDRCWKILKNGGRMVSTVSAPSQEKALLCGVRASKLQTRTRADELSFMGALIANGELKVTTDWVLPLSRASEALEMSRCGHVRGKIVMTIDHDRE